MGKPRWHQGLRFFNLSGSCRYRLADDQLCGFTVSNIKLLIPQPDGSVRAVEGSLCKRRRHTSIQVPHRLNRSPRFWSKGWVSPCVCGR